MSIQRAARLAGAFIAFLAALAAGPASAAVTYTFETAEWKLEWQDFQFGVSSWSGNDVSLTWGKWPGLDELGNVTARGLDIPGWGAVSASGSHSSDVSNTGTTFLLSAQPGYQLTDLGVRASGVYQSLGSTASVDPKITMQLVAVNGELHPVLAVAALNFEFGTWSVDTGVAVPGAVPNTALSFNVRQSVSTNSFLDVANSAGGLNGISLYWTAAPVPEPHEWAMMLSGLGVVGVIARRRRRLAERR